MSNSFWGFGDWGLGLGIGDWGLGPIPNPQSPIPNPQSPYINKIIYYIFLFKFNHNKIKKYILSFIIKYK